MREGWSRTTPLLTFSLAQLSHLIQPVAPGDRVVAVTPCAGGLANTNLCLMLAGRAKPLLLRVYTRDAGAWARERALNALVAERVPAPMALAWEPSNPFTGHPYLLRDWCDGVRLEVVAPTLDDATLGLLGERLGAVMAAIHGLTFAQAGFFASDLTVVEPFDASGPSLLAYARSCLAGIAGERLVPSGARLCWPL